MYNSSNRSMCSLYSSYSDITLGGLMCMFTYWSALSAFSGSRELACHSVADLAFEAFAPWQGETP